PVNSAWPTFAEPKTTPPFGNMASSFGPGAMPTEPPDDQLLPALILPPSQVKMPMPPPPLTSLRPLRAPRRTLPRDRHATRRLEIAAAHCTRAVHCRSTKLPQSAGEVWMPADGQPAAIRLRGTRHVRVGSSYQIT